MSIPGTPIWVTDPAGNDDPFLKIVQAIFVLALNASFSGPTWTTPAQVWWSLDGKTWTQATTPADGLSLLQISPHSGVNYFNGVWFFEYSWDAGIGGGTLADIVVYSYDGMNWQLGFKPSASQISQGVYFAVAFDNVAANTITINNNQFVSPPKVFTINVPVKNPGSQPNRVAFGDSISSSNILVDPSQGGGSLTFGGGSQGAYASNPLPLGITAVRLRAVPAEQAQEVAVDYTATPITQAIVNASPNMSTATWVTGLDKAGESGATNTTLFFGWPSGSGV